MINGPSPWGGVGEGLLDKAYDRSPTIRARALPNDPTEAEKHLWRAIRSRQLMGTRFNRQVPIGPYICDFVSRARKLIVEVDGGQHAAALDQDRQRSDFLTARGYRVIRFWNNDVPGNIEGVVEMIMRALEDMPSPTPPDNGRG